MASLAAAERDIAALEKKLAADAVRRAQCDADALAHAAALAGANAATERCGVSMGARVDELKERALTLDAQAERIAELATALAAAQAASGGEACAAPQSPAGLDAASASNKSNAKQYALRTTGDDSEAGSKELRRARIELAAAMRARAECDAAFDRLEREERQGGEAARGAERGERACAAPDATAFAPGAVELPDGECDARCWTEYARAAYPRLLARVAADAELEQLLSVAALVLGGSLLLAVALLLNVHSRRAYASAAALHGRKSRSADDKLARVREELAQRNSYAARLEHECAAAQRADAGGGGFGVSEHVHKRALAANAQEARAAGLKLKEAMDELDTLGGQVANLEAALAAAQQNALRLAPLDAAVQRARRDASQCAAERDASRAQLEGAEEKVRAAGAGRDAAQRLLEVAEARVAALEAVVAALEAAALDTAAADAAAARALTQTPPHISATPSGDDSSEWGDAWETDEDGTPRRRMSPHAMMAPSSARVRSRLAETDTASPPGLPTPSATSAVLGGSEGESVGDEGAADDADGVAATAAAKKVRSSFLFCLLYILLVAHPSFFCFDCCGRRAPAFSRWPRCGALTFFARPSLRVAVDQRVVCRAPLSSPPMRRAATRALPSHDPPPPRQRTRASCAWSSSATSTASSPRRGAR